MCFQLAYNQSSIDDNLVAYSLCLAFIKMQNYGPKHIQQQVLLKNYTICLSILYNFLAQNFSSLSNGLKLQRSGRAVSTSASQQEGSWFTTPPLKTCTTGHDE